MLPVFFESDVLCDLSEALSAEVEAVFCVVSSVLSAASAFDACLAVASFLR